MTTDTSLGRPEDLPVPESAPPLKTVPEVDDALLAEAQMLLGVLTESDTVNLALTGLITEQRRQAAVEAQIRRFQAGQFRAQRHGSGERP